MTVASLPPEHQSLHHSLTSLRANWGLFVALGVLLVVLGWIALGAIVITSLATALAIGCLMLFGGAAETFGAFFTRRWSGFFFHALSGILSLVVGFLFLRAPVGALLVLTMLLACLLMVSGIFKIVAASNYRFSAWAWPLIGGFIDLILGIMICAQWPASAFWVLGMFLGINLIFRGFNWIGLGMALRARQRSATPVEIPR